MSERLQYIDTAKGIGILLVVVGHILWGRYTPWLHTIINVFHMPFWFFVSMLFFKRVGLHELIRRKAKRLLIPYIIYGLFALILYVIITPPHQQLDIKEQIIRFCFGMRSHGYMFSSTLWFLSALFGSWILFTIITKIKSRIGICAFLLILVLIGGMADYYDVILPFNADVSIYMLPYCFLGYYSRNLLSIIGDWTKHNSLNFLFMSILVFCIYCFCFKTMVLPDINIYSCKFGLYPFQYILALGGVMMLISFSIWISNYGDTFVSRVLGWLGKNSIIIFIIHQAFIIHPMNCYDILTGNTFANGIIRFSMVMLLSIISIPIINKCFYWSIGLEKIR